MSDFTFHNGGNACILTPITHIAKLWVEDNISTCAIWYNGGIVIEPRYVEPIIDDAIDNDLTIEEV